MGHYFQSVKRKSALFFIDSPPPTDVGHSRTVRPRFLLEERTSISALVLTIHGYSPICLPRGVLGIPLPRSAMEFVHVQPFCF